MCDAQHKRMVVVLLECDEIREAFDRGLSNCQCCLPRTRPYRIRLRCCSDSLKRHSNRRDEFVPEFVAPFFVPERGGAKLGAGLRM